MMNNIVNCVRYAAVKDLTDDCTPDIAATVVLQYRHVGIGRTNDASAATGLTGQEDDWQSVLIPIACSVAKGRNN
jgi:hypothetical protein